MEAVSRDFDEQEGKSIRIYKSNTLIYILVIAAIHSVCAYASAHPTMMQISFPYKFQTSKTDAPANTSTNQAQASPGMHLEDERRYPRIRHFLCHQLRCFQREGR